MMFVGIVLLVIFFVSLILDKDSDKPSRSERKELRKEKAELIQDKQILTAALIKIAANDSGNPPLDAQIALNDVSTREYKALGS